MCFFPDVKHFQGLSQCGQTMYGGVLNSLNHFGNNFNLVQAMLALTKMNVMNWTAAGMTH